MTDFNNNNKFVPSTPKTYTVSELRDTQQVKQPSLSAAARSKIINRSGSNYLSESKESYGPCLFGSSGCSITAILTDKNGHSRVGKS